jgi:hypothetical protein
MALLWEQLPADSRTARIEEPTLEWGTSEYLLWKIEYQLRCLTWGLSYDKKHPTPKPQPILTPAQRAEAMRKRDAALANRAEIDRALGMEDTDA